MKLLLIGLILMAPLAASFCEKEDQTPSYSTDCKKCKEKTHPK